MATNDWIIPVGSAAASAAASIFSARSAQKFSERMSSTAHQREVADLKKAGLNPMLSAHRGASAPQGVVPDVSGSVQRGVGTALAAQQQRANIELTRAQADAAGAAAGLSRTQAADISTTWASGRGDSVRAQGDLAILERDFQKMTFEQRKELFATSVERAKKELEMAGTAAKHAEVSLSLAKMLEEGSAKNIADFEKRVGAAGPAVKFLIDLVRLMGMARHEQARYWGPTAGKP